MYCVNCPTYNDKRHVSRKRRSCRQQLVVIIWKSYSIRNALYYFCMALAAGAPATNGRLGTGDRFRWRAVNLSLRQTLPPPRQSASASNQPRNEPRWRPRRYMRARHPTIRPDANPSAHDDSRTGWTNYPERAIVSIVFLNGQALIWACGFEFRTFVLDNAWIRRTIDACS